MTRSKPFSLAFSAALCLVPAALPAVDFIRGDLDSDGVASVADAYYAVNWYFRGGPPPACLLTADIQDEGNLEDRRWAGSRILIRLTNPEGVGFEAPHPQPGPDPTPNSDPALVCDAYGGGSALEDPIAELKVLDAIAPGGDEDTATLTVALSSSTPVIGYRGALRFADGGLASPARSDFHGLYHWPQLTDLTDTVSVTYIEGRDGQMYEDHDACTRYQVWNNRLSFAFLNNWGLSLKHGETLGPAVPIPAGQDIPVAQIRVCLDQGTKAGDYSLVLEEGELVDVASGRRIVPRLESGTLTVLSDLAPGKGCPKLAAKPCEVPPEEVSAQFQIEGGVGTPGGSVSLPLIFRTNSFVSGFSFSVDFDEEALEATGVEQTYVMDRLETLNSPEQDPTKFAFHHYGFDNGNAVPGNGGVDEGFLSGAAVLTFDARDQLPPANQDVEILRFHFNVRPEAATGSTEVRFLDGAPLTPPQTGTATNMVVLCYQGASPETSHTPVYLDGWIAVIDEVTIFLRGDANGDEKVDISDPVDTLGFLFQGGRRPDCFDAADSNDDGKLEITDPIGTLEVLFRGGSGLPLPYPAPGEDPTEDGLGCLFRS
jgi:hypothetical protein